MRDVEIVKAALLALLVGCAPTPMPMNVQHPAHPDAATGRLAGPPAALRPGVADLSTPARSSAQTDHSGHGNAPKAPEPSKTEPKTEPSKTEPTKTTPKPPAKKARPAERPSNQEPPPASKTTPGTEPPKQPPPVHKGHEGHH